MTYSRKVTSKLSLFKLNRNNEIAEDSELISIDLNFSEKTNYDLISVYDLFDFKTNDIKTLRDVDKIVVRLLLDLSQRLEKRYLLTGLEKKVLKSFCLKVNVGKLLRYLILSSINMFKVVIRP